MNTFAPFYILSAALAGDDAANATERTATLAHQLRASGFAVDSVRGCYMGQTEPALIAIPFDRSCADSERAVLRFARLYGQESILAVDANRAATLVFCADETRRVPLGQFYAVDECVARTRDAWTERNGQYYTCGG